VQGSGSATEVEQIGQHGEGIKPRKFHFRLMHKIDYRIPNDSSVRQTETNIVELMKTLPYLR